MVLRMILSQGEDRQINRRRKDVKENGRKRSKKDAREQKHNKISKKDKVLAKRLLEDEVII